MSKYRYEMGGIIRDTEIDFPYYTDEIIEDEMPEEVEGQYIEEYYEQNNGIIYKHYKYVPIVLDEFIIEE